MGGKGLFKGLGRERGESGYFVVLKREDDVFFLRFLEVILDFRVNRRI